MCIQSSLRRAECRGASRSPSLNRATANRGSRLSRRGAPSVGASRSPSYQSNRKIPAKRDRCTCHMEDEGDVSILSWGARAGLGGQVSFSELRQVKPSTGSLPVRQKRSCLSVHCFTPSGS